MKVIVPPTVCELSISTGTFFENYDVINREALYVRTYSTVRKQTKRKEKHLMETTIWMSSILMSTVLLQTYKRKINKTDPRIERLHSPRYLMLGL